MHIDNNIFCFDISFKFKRNWKNPFGRLQRYDYGVPAEEYWKHHMRPDLSIL